MKIGFRITLLMIFMSLVSVGVLGVVLIQSSWRNAERLAEGLTRSKARQLSGDFDSFLELNWQKVSIAANTMGKLFQTVPDSARRGFLNDVLWNMIDGDKDILTVFSIWEPDVLEGNDRAWANTPGSSETGRFLPGFVYSSAGEIVEIILNPSGFINADFYLQPVRYGRQIITNPYRMPIAGEERLVATISAPIRNRENRIVGVVGIDLALNHLNEIGQDIQRLYDGRATSATSIAFSNNGTVVSHPVQENIGEDMRITETVLLGEHVNPLANAIKQGAEYTFQAYVGNNKQMFFITSVNIADFNEPWAIGIGMPLYEIHSGTYAMIRFAVILCIVVQAAIIAAAFWTSRSIARPIKRMAKTLKDIATGDGDLTVSLPDTSRDEIGEASMYFNETIKKIRGLVVAIRNKADTLSDIGNDLASNMTETAAAMNEIVANLQSMKGRVINQSASVVETNSTMEQVTVNIDKLGNFVDKQTEAVSQSSSAIEEMLANIQSVTATLARNSKRVVELQDSSESGRSSLQEVASDIQEISRESEGLLEINTVMENIASQTNLLSMNAAIEAAHAGESGKGFAVVADEIRKLAESSSEQSKTIGTVLRKIKESIDKITRSTNSVIKDFEAIDNGVKAVARQGDEIRSAMEEQGEGSRQVLQASGQVHEITQQVKGGSTEMLEGSKEVIQESKNLEIVTQEITNGINEMASGAEQVNEAINSVNELSGKNRENISALVEAVSQFKV